MQNGATPADGVPEEELRFPFLSGRLCLAFCATVGERWRGNFERLRAPADLARWYVEAGLIGDLIPVSAAGVQDARLLREAVYRVAKALIAGDAPPGADEEIINLAAAAPPLIPQMHDGAARWAAPHADAEAAALSAVARDAIEVFTGPLSKRVRECASGECGLLFLDISRPGQRRWCSSSACGGRARSAAYRRRQARREPGPASA